MRNINYTELKSYEMINVFEYYDFSLIFISKSPTEEYYFNYYIEELEDGTNKWFISEISNVERLDILGQRVSMLNFLKKLKDNLRLTHLFIEPIEEDFRNKYEIVSDLNFDSESFPEEDFYAEYDYLTKNDLVSVSEEILDTSNFKVVLKNAINSHDIEVDLLIGILNNLKKSLKSIANDLGLDNETIDLKVDSLQPSSFGMYLKSENDIFNTSGRALGKLFEFLEGINTNTLEKIEDIIETDMYSITTVKEVNELLKDIKKNNYTIAVQSTVEKDGTPIQVKFDRFSYDKVESISNMLLKTDTEIEEIHVVGTLNSINAKSNNFSIKVNDSEYRGSMSKELFKQVKESEISFKVPAEINAVIIKETKQNIQNETGKVRYRLKEFTQNDAVSVI